MKRKATAPPKRRSDKRRRLAQTSTTIPRLAPPRGVEKKWIDTFNATAGAPAATYGSATGFVGTFDVPVHLNAIAQGAGSSQRIGRRIRMTSIQLRMTFVSGIASTCGGRFRIMVVYDKQTNGSALLPAQVLDTDYAQANMNLSNSERFVVVYDKYSPVLGASAVGAVGTGSAPVASTMKLYRKLRLETTFNTSAAGSVAAIATGSLYLMVAQAGFQSANPGYAYNIRVRYTDE